MNKIVELLINFDEFEMDDLGVEIISLVDAPAIEVNWMAFSKEEDAAFEEHVLKIAAEVGEPFDPEEIVYVDITKSDFATLGEYLRGIQALDILSNLPEGELDKEADIRYRYAGPSAQRSFCTTLKAVNRMYTREQITLMNNVNTPFGHNRQSYSVFKYKGGPNCRHFWESLAVYRSGGQQVIVSLGPVRGNGEERELAGKSNNDDTPSPEGSVRNNAYFNSQWAFSSDEKQIVTGPAMIPLQLIARRDEKDNLFHVYFSEETIEKISKKFLSDNNTHNTDINHDNNIVTSNTLLESWIVEDPEKDKAAALGFNVPKGTWMTSYKINDKETWNKIKNGELNGFSVTGSFLEKLQK